MKRRIKVSQPILELPTLLPRTNESQERVSDVVANTTTQEQTYFELTVHGTKLEPKHPALKSTKRRDQHLKLKPPPTKPSVEGLKHQPPYTASPEATEERDNQTNNQNTHLLKGRKKRPLQDRDREVTRNLKLLKHNRLVLLTTHNQAQ